MQDFYNTFPDLIRAGSIDLFDKSFVELVRYKVGDTLRWEGYYMNQRLSLYHNGYFWIVEAFWKGEVRGYFRHYKEVVSLEDVQQLVKAACSLISIFKKEV